MLKKPEFSGIPLALAGGDAADTRLPYEAPRLQWEGLFEVLALSCGKTNPVSFNCGRVPRLS